MTEQDVVTVLRDLFLTILKVGALPLLAMLAVGLFVSLIQAVTQVNEQTLSFVPKLLTLLAVLAIGEHFLWSALDGFTREAYDRMIEIGGR